MQTSHSVHSPAGAGSDRAVCFSTAALLLLFAAPPLTATTYVVDRLDDSTVGSCSLSPNDCALRGAILAANAHAGDDIVMLPIAATYTLSIGGSPEELGYTGDLDVLDGLTIVGRGRGRAVIYAAGIDRVFDVDAPGKRLTLRGLTVTGGQTIAGEPGGGIRAEAGSLTLESARVSGSSTIDGWGGAIYSVSEGAGDDTRIIDSYITNNISLGQTLVTKKIRLERSTVAGNYTDASSAIVVYGGGGIVNSTVTSHIASGNHSVVAIVGGEISIMSCTLSHPGGPVFYIQDAGVELANTIIEGTCSGPDLPSSIGGNLESPGHTCNLGSYDLGDVPGPVVSALGWFGGPTPVHRPLAGSVVIDHPWAGHECQLSDQRQAPRPRDGDGSGGVGCDIGAVELFAPGEIFLDGFECGFTTAWSAVAP